MTAKYYAILTSQGAARLANAAALGTKLNLTQMAVGDANGKLPTPDPAQTKLINQKRIAPLNLLNTDPTNPDQIIAEQVIPENEGGFWIREIGLYDDSGVLIAVANCPETYKPLLQEGSGRTQTIRMILIVSSTTAITLKIDPAVVLATRQYVDDKVIEVKNYVDDAMKKHLDNKDPHTQYAPKASPTLTGTPKSPTPAAGNNSTQIATTAFVQGEAVSTVSAAALPFPDVWAPLNDDLRLLAGFAPYDTLNIAGQTLELPTKSLSFQRASTATYIDKSGNLQIAAMDEPRFGKQGLLIEGQSTNLCKYSDPGNAYWTRYGDVVVTGEDNGLTRIVTKSDSYCGVYGAVPGLTPGNTYTVSCWLKGISGKNIRIMAEGAGKSVIYSQAKDLPELTRISLTFVAVRAVETISLYAGSAGSEFVIGRVQLEELPFVTSFIPTNGTAVTRAPEFCSFPYGNNMPDPLREDFTMALELELSDINNNMRMDIIGDLRYTPAVGAFINENNEIDSRINEAWQAKTVPVKKKSLFAFGYDGANVLTSQDGDLSRSPLKRDDIKSGKPVTDVNKIGVMSRLGAPVRTAYGHVRNLRIWHRALTDKQIRGLS